MTALIERFTQRKTFAPANNSSSRVVGICPRCCRSGCLSDGRRKLLLRHFASCRMAISAVRYEVWHSVLMARLCLNHLWTGGAKLVQVSSRPRDASGLVSARRHFIQVAHRRNLTIQGRAMNKGEEMDQLIELGTDGLIPDFPTD